MIHLLKKWGHADSFPYFVIYMYFELACLFDPYRNKLQLLLSL